MATLETGLVHRASNHFVSLTARSQKSLKIPVQDRQKHILDFFNFTGVCSSGLVLTPPSMTTKALVMHWAESWQSSELFKNIWVSYSFQVARCNIEQS